MFGDGKIDIAKMSILPKVRYRSSAIHTQIPLTCLSSKYKPNTHMAPEKTSNRQSNFDKDQS